METFRFKNYVYTIVDLPSKAAFDAIYRDLLDKANKGKSIVKELEKAYRIGSRELYLIRYDEVRRALVPVRAAKESVDGFLMKDRFDGKDNVVQRGIGTEMAHRTKEAYDTVERKHKMMDQQRALSNEKKHADEARLEIDGHNWAERIELFAQTAREIKTLLERADYKYQDDRDYKGRVDQAFERIAAVRDEAAARLAEVNKDPAQHAGRVRNLFPADVPHDNPPAGFLRLLETFLFLSVLATGMEKEYTSLRDYALDKNSCPVKARQLVDDVFVLANNLRRLLFAVDRMVNPSKIGAQRDPGFDYGIQRFTAEALDILAPRPKEE